MKLRILIFFLITICTQYVSAVEDPSSPLTVTAKSSDGQFLLMDNDSAWFVITDQLEGFESMGADENDLDLIHVGDSITLSKEEDSPIYTMANELHPVEVCALKVDGLFKTEVTEMPTNNVVELFNGLHLHVADNIYSAVEKWSPITMALVCQDVLFQDRWYHFEFQWVFTTHRNWMIEKIQEDEVHGNVEEATAPDLWDGEQDMIIARSQQRKRIQLGNGEIFLRTEYSGKDEDENLLIENWPEGSHAEVADIKEPLIYLKHREQQETQTFLRPTFTTTSKVVSRQPMIITKNNIAKKEIWLWLENGLIIHLDPYIEFRFNMYDLVTFTFLNAHHVPQKEGEAATMIYQYLYDHDNHYEYSSEDVMVNGYFGQTPTSRWNGRFLQ